MNPSILTYSGEYFSFVSPKVSSLSFQDIAHALSNLCRFTGHTREFYSVAQHSVLVSQNVPIEFALQGLMHDAGEAFLSDIPSPLKKLLPDYHIIEQRVEKKLFDYFNISFPFHFSVKKADLILLATEKRDLLTKHEDYEYWDILQGVNPLRDTIVPLPPKEAKELFLNRFNEIQGIK
jgi:5'-deoxynucleotidase YfbR-like HD superfamily hydrolase